MLKAVCQNTLPFHSRSVVDHEKVRVSELAPGPGLRSLDLES